MSERSFKDICGLCLFLLLCGTSRAISEVAEKCEAFRVLLGGANPVAYPGRKSGLVSVEKDSNLFGKD